MSEFITPLRTEKSGSVWIILQALVYVSDVAQRTFLVPPGFVTDFASVPRIPLAFLVAGDTAHEAAVIHDYAYKRGFVSRKVADDVLMEAALVSGEPLWRARLMWLGVRLGGWIAWNRYRNAQK